MTYQLTILAKQRPETLERILRVCRHRGFRISKMHAESVQNTIQLNLVIESEREISLLFNQLIKLPDVLEIKKQS